MQIDRIALSAEHQALLQGIQTKQAALQAFVSYVTGEGQRRAEALFTENQAVWDQVAQDLGLDLKKVEYALSDDGKELVPARVKL